MEEFRILLKFGSLIAEMNGEIERCRVLLSFGTTAPKLGNYIYENCGRKSRSRIS